jgi:hypothetical protein
MVLVASAWGQPVASPEQGDLDQQRQRIETVRREKTAELDAQDAACLSRFAVTDCQNKVGVRRREMLADLKRQEARLNDADRRKKGAEQMQRSQDKAADRALREADARADHEGEGDTPQERQKALDDKVLNHKKQAKTAAPSAPANKTASGLDAPSIEKNREAYAEKQRAAEQRRLDRERRLLDKGSGSAPLPQNP